MSRLRPVALTPTAAVVVAAAAVVLAAAFALSPAALAEESTAAQLKDDARDLGRTIGKAARDVGREVGEAGREVGREAGKAGREVGREIADGARKAWYKGKEVSAPLLEEVQRATREFWRGVLEQKDETLADLRRRNEELKKRREAGR